MRWIYLSPHPDDAALCAGGMIYDQARAGEQVEIWTLMCGVPEGEWLSDFAREMHAKWGTTSAIQTMQVREAEDRRAAELLGARLVRFSFLDAIYRRGPEGEALYGDPVGAAEHPADALLPGLISRAVAPRLRRVDRLVCLLGIGGHVDHSLVRRAAEMWSGVPRYVADFPYVMKHPEAVEGQTAGMQSTVVPVSEQGLEAWARAVEAYTSQLDTVFEDGDASRAVRAYGASEGGVRVWSPQQA
jgi:LmbE family N-acetylglucosaminyl deacetylase